MSCWLMTAIGERQPKEMGLFDSFVQHNGLNNVSLVGSGFMQSNVQGRPYL